MVDLCLFWFLPTHWLRFTSLILMRIYAKAIIISLVAKKINLLRGRRIVFSSLRLLFLPTSCNKILFDCCYWIIFAHEKTITCSYGLGWERKPAETRSKDLDNCFVNHSPKTFLIERKLSSERKVEIEYNFADENNSDCSKIFQKYLSKYYKG